MKMIYHQKNNRFGRFRFSNPIVVFLLIATALSLLIFFAPSFSNRVSMVFAKPLLISRSFIGNQLNFLADILHSRASLIEESNSLREELDKTKANLLFYGALEAEHQKLLETFGRSKNLPRKIAVVLAKPPQSPYDTLVLDVGTKSGVDVGQSVFGFGNTALGKISSVDENHSTATLFSNSNVETHVTIERSGLTIAIKGNGGGGFEARVPQDTDISMDDIIVLPGLSPAPIGKVVRIDATPASSFKSVFINSAININHVRWVEIEID